MRIPESTPGTNPCFSLVRCLRAVYGTTVQERRRGIEPGFRVVRGNLLEDLRAHLVTSLRSQPLEPLEEETILVQSNGIAQWIKFSLAETDIAMGMDVILPARFQWKLYRSIPESAEIPRHSPYDTDRLLWRIMRLLPKLLKREEFAPLKPFLEFPRDDDPEFLTRSHQLSATIADLFDQYQVYRADWLTAWAREGEDPLGTGSQDAHRRWQATLWRELVQDTPEPLRMTDRGTIHRRFMEYLDGIPPEAPPAALPRRVIVFGISSLAEQVIEVLHGISRFTEVVFFVQDPCRSHLWRHPLLTAWGRQGRDFLDLLQERVGPDQEETEFRSPGTATVLQRLQNDILENKDATVPRPDDSGSDRSVQFHVAHSALREVEILHDRLLDALDSDPDLNPRDVIVMVPEIKQYGPLVDAVFGRLRRDDPRFIPYSVSDRGENEPDRITLAVETLLGLPRSRVTLEDVGTLLEVPAVHRRYGLSAGEVEAIVPRLADAGVRWGLHGDHRETFGVPAGCDRNTWRFGLQRILLGYALGEEAEWNGVVALEGVGSATGDTAGRVFDLVDDLERYRRELDVMRPPGEWTVLLRTMLERFFLMEDQEELQRLDAFYRALQVWEDACTEADFHTPLPVGVVRDAWLAHAEPTNLQRRFLGGSVTFATLMPMRAIPFRMVCLLGMNDGDYPRQTTGPGFDLMKAVDGFRRGDRSRREDDRYLFLEALLSARNRLYVSWIGRSISDNSERPASVLVGQLRDHLEIDGVDPEEITTDHPLQPFAPAYFSREGPLFTYAHEWIPRPGRTVSALPQGDQTVTWPAQPSPSGQPPSTPAATPSSTPQITTDRYTVEPRVIRLRDLLNFLRNPPELFFHEALRVRFAALQERELPRDEPFDPDSLEAWQLKNDLLRHALEDPDRSTEEHLCRLTRSGRIALPPFEDVVEQKLLRATEGIIRRYREESEPVKNAVPFSRTVSIRSSDGSVTLEDVVPELKEGSDGMIRRIFVSPSRVHDGHGSYRWEKLLSWWPAHLASQYENGPVLTVIVAANGTVTLPPIGPTRAAPVLQDLIDAWSEAVLTPLPVSVRAGCAWVTAYTGDEHSRETAEKKARDALTGTFNRDGEYRENEYLRRLVPDPLSLVGSDDFVCAAERLYRPLTEVFT